MPSITKSSFFQGPGLIIIAAFLWGIDGVFRRDLGTLHPLTIVFFEHLIGFIVLLPFVWSSLFREKVSRKELGAIMLVALFSGLFGTLLFTAALLQTLFISFSVVFLLQKLQPLFAIVTARIVLKEKAGTQYIPWAIVALVAAYFTTFPGGIVNFATGPGTVRAALFALGAAFAWGMSTTFSKIALSHKPTNYITAMRFLWTIIFAFIGLVIFHPVGSFVLPNTTQFGTLLLIALSTGMVSLALYYRGLKNTPVAVSAILELLFPLVAVGIDVLIYHHTLATSQYIAGIILMIAIYKVGHLTNKFKQ